MEDRELIEDLYSIRKPWFVSRVVVNTAENRLDAYLDHKDDCTWKCPKCDREYHLSDHVDERIWRDLDSGTYQVYLHARIPRIRCEEHGKLLVAVPWSEKHSRFSKRFESFAINLMKEMPILNASSILGISWFQAHGIMLRAVKRGLARKVSHPSRVGIDEKSYGKGHRYLTLIYNHDSPAVDFIAFDRKEESLDLYFESIGEENSSRICAVSMDMWDPYIASTRSHIDDAESRIVFDRFHIMKHMNMALDDVRKEESRSDRRDLLRKSRYIWLYSHENLPEKYRERYEELRQSDLKTARAYAIKENLRNMWLCSSVEEARSFWKNWYWWATHSRLVPVIRAARTIKHYLYGVLSYFRHRITNAMAEGLNSKIATLSKMAYGYRNREHFKTAIYFHCGNLNMSF